MRGCARLTCGLCGLAVHRFVPLLHTTAQNAHSCKSGDMQTPRSSRGALVGPADEHNRSPSSPASSVNRPTSSATGILRAVAMWPSGPVEFIRPPGVDDGHRFAMVEPALELGRLDPRERAAQPSDPSKEGANFIDRPRACRADIHRPRPGTVAAACGRCRAREDRGTARSQSSSPRARRPAGRGKSPTAGPTKAG